jgi:hypothetical protein
MLMASMSIFCRKRTTGASSTSGVTSVFSVGPLSSSVTSKSKSELARLSSTSLALVLWLSTWRISLSYSTITHSGVNCVANLMRSTASWSVGSAAPMKRRLPRLPSTISWYWVAIFWSTRLRGSFWVSTAFRSSRGSASADDSVWARSSGFTAPALITAAMKLVLRSRAPLVSSSAVLALSLPALTSTRATPESEDCGGSTWVSAAISGGSGSAYPDDHRRSSRRCKRQKSRQCPVKTIGYRLRLLPLQAVASQRSGHS